MNYETARAQLAYDFSTIEKSNIPEGVFKELVGDFEKKHKEISVKKTVKNPDPFGWNVYATAEIESMELYEDWRRQFSQHGYEPPFLTIGS